MSEAPEERTLQEQCYGTCWAATERIAELEQQLAASHAHELALREALEDAKAHLGYCGYGDRYERECAYEEKLPEKIEAALSAPPPPVIRQEVAEKLAEALEWAMGKEPSPCRCIPFATPPHVCAGHKALNTYRVTQPKHNALYDKLSKEETEFID